MCFSLGSAGLWTYSLHVTMQGMDAACVLTPIPGGRTAPRQREEGAVLF